MLPTLVRYFSADPSLPTGPKVKPSEDFPKSPQDSPVMDEIKKMKKITEMPMKTPSKNTAIFGGALLGFMAVLWYTDNMNRQFFKNLYGSQDRK